MARPTLQEQLADARRQIAEQQQQIADLEARLADYAHVAGLVRNVMGDLRESHEAGQKFIRKSNMTDEEAEEIERLKAAGRTWAEIDKHFALQPGGAKKRLQRHRKRR
jgi:hypothetical protein